MDKNYYKVLNLENGASKEEIKIAYRNIAKKYHPDKYMTKSLEEQEVASKKFLECKEAYEKLSNLSGENTSNKVKTSDSLKKNKKESFLEKMRREKNQKMEDIINNIKNDIKDK